MQSTLTPPAPAAATASVALWRASWDVYLAGALTRTQLERRADERFRDLVEHARAAVPLYRRLYTDAPPTRLLRLDELPVVRKHDLIADLEATLAPPRPTRADIDAFIADPARAGEVFDGRWMLWTSSGTTGVPAVFVHDVDALAVYQALEMIRFRGLGSWLRLGARALTGERYALVAATGGHFAGVATIEHLRRTWPWIGETVRAFSLLQPLPRLVEQLRRFRPDLLATYPTAAEVLADAQTSGALDLRLTELWTGGECLAPATRQRLERTFGCRVRESYGASEALAIAWACEHGTMHANVDYVILEAVDAQMRPVPPGTSSHTTLLTNLPNRAQPLIRYDLGDSITWLPGRCPCGSPLPMLRVEGRRDDVLAFDAPDGKGVIKLVPLALETVLEEQGGVHDFQLVQEARGLCLRLGPADLGTAPRAIAALRRYLDVQGLPQVSVRAHGVPRRSDTSGKLQRVCREHRGEAGAAKRAAPGVFEP